MPHPSGLQGHSDGDVLLHAIADAILGAAGLASLGEHFPDDDAATEGADSGPLLGRVSDVARRHGFDIVNVDAVVIGEAPQDRAAPRRDAGADRRDPRLARGPRERARDELERPRVCRPGRGPRGHGGRPAPAPTPSRFPWKPRRRGEILARAFNPIAEAVRSRPREIEFVLFDSNRRDRRIRT